MLHYFHEHATCYLQYGFDKNDNHVVSQEPIPPIIKHLRQSSCGHIIQKLNQYAFHYLPLQYALYPSKIQIITLPQKNEWTYEVSNWEYIDSTCTGGERDSQCDPQHGRKHSLFKEI